MSDIQTASDDRNILDFIRTLCANGESGRLEILAGTIQGELSFADGKLIDARVGHLTGFRAINAVAAIRDARYSFDPTFSPIASSSITGSERVVLKQFFGIDTAATNEYMEPVGVLPEAAAPAVIPVPDAADEITIVRSHAADAGSDVKDAGSFVTNAAIPAPLPHVPAPLPHVPAPHVSRFSHRTALAFAALIIAVVAAAALLIYKSREARSPAVVASAESASRPEPAKQPEPVVAHATPAESVPAAAAVKRDQREPKSLPTGRDLSGKWRVINTIETTSYGSFKNMKIGFNLSINQTGTTFTGSGLKVSENGRNLPADSRTPIQVKGSINGDRIEATFFEQGAARKSNGKFVWRIDKAGRGLTGNFATSAARSSGKSAATREL